MMQPLLRHMRRCGALTLTSLLAITLIGMAVHGQADTAAAQTPSIALSAPAQVAVGAPLILTVSGSGLEDLAAFEAHLLFDSTAASFDTVVYDDATFAAAGRAVHPLDEMALPDGAAF